MPKRRPLGPPKWQKKKELTTKTNEFPVPIATAAMIATDTDSKADFKIGLDGTVGLEAAAVADSEAPKEDEMTTVGSTSVMTVIAVIFFVAKIKLEVINPGPTKTKTVLALQSQRLQT